MISYKVDLGQRSYPILIGEGVINLIGSEMVELAPTKILLVTNETIAPLYADVVQKQIQDRLPKVPLSVCILPDGEEYKNLKAVQRILDSAAELGMDRSSVIVALGGGVVGDIAGFAASMWMRGIRFVQIPTTLLAQVDSSVGGKTGVNLPQGKNLIGAFHQPSFVLIDPAVLRTLPSREISAGLGEVIKYGLLGDEPFFCRLEKDISKLRQLEMRSLEEVIAHCCRMKAEVVKKDEKEAGIRATLNLGHTFAHAIEKLFGYGVWLHGEAVGVGLVMAASLSRTLDLLSRQEEERVRALVLSAGLRVNTKKFDVKAMVNVMHADKKAQGNELRFVLIQGIGTSVCRSVKEEVVCSVLQEFLQNETSVSD